MDNASSAENASRAEETLLKFLDNNRSPTRKELDALIEDNQEIGAELFAAIARWARGKDALDELGFASSTVLSDDQGTSTPGERIEEETPFTADLRSRLSHQGDRKQRYIDAAEIARGGMGRILSAFDSDLQRPLALKILRDGQADEESWKAERREARFVEEAQVTAQLDHPGIVPVHDLGVDDRGRIFFTLKLVKGRTLSEVLEEHREGLGSWTTTRILNILLQVCEAMAYAHEKGVIHRDLKPSNVMVGRYGEVFVMDFGLARVLNQEDRRDIRIRPGQASEVVTSDRTRITNADSESPLMTMDGDVVGTPAYMPPEQARGEIAAVGPRSDIYGVGAMLYHLLSESAPYSDQNPSDAYDLLAMVIEGPPTKLGALAPETPNELLSICARAMGRTSARRYHDMKSLADDLRAYLENRVVQAHKIGAVAELRMWVRRNRGLAAACVALVFSAVVGAGGWAWLVNDRNTQLAEAATQRQRALDVLTARDLLDDEAHHSPDPKGVQRMTRFLNTVDDLLTRRRINEATLADPSGIEQELREDLDEFLENLDVLSARRSIVKNRREAAIAAERISLTDYADAWSNAREQIRSSEHYRGLDLSPQVGLVPLRQNPQTGFWEFWHILTGNRPDPDRLTPDSGTVFVLLPGATIDVGSPEDDPEKDTDEDWHRVTIPPFFISRFEVTQAQFVRLMNRNPSQYRPEVSDGDIFVNELHPVESVSRQDAKLFARLCGTRLPGEKEWEYAYRGGDYASYGYGDQISSLEGHENIADAALYAEMPLDHCVTWNDGYVVHAPVGTFKPNAFGLNDLGGNVSEWTAHLYREEYGEPSGGPTVDAGRENRHASRGGNCASLTTASRAATRQPMTTGSASFTIGFRLARSIDE